MLRFFTIICAFFVLISAHSQAQKQHFHHRNINSIEEGTDLPTGFNSIFGASGECLLCHNDMTDNAGTPIGLLDDWRSTMMANAAKDPLWRAKVSHEKLVNPGHAAVLEDICIRCHAPLGSFNAHHLGQELYSMDEMTQDSIALDGVSCTLCHQIMKESLGNYSGDMLIGTDWEIWGPYEEPFPNPMINHTGFTPTYGEQVFDSKLCGSCHTLITNTVDLDGELSGGQFVEQAIYHEWLNSSFSESDIHCQNCHVPEISDDVKISTMPPWLETRSPFGKHLFVGGNIYMQKILKNNIEELCITSDEARFDSTISRTDYLLKHATIDLNIEEINRTNDILSLAININNRAGHKFPAGFPSRRAFVEIILVDDTFDTIFHSGKMNENFEIIEEDVPYEEHHAVITQDTQVQVYEIVMGDVNGNYTTVLERAASPLKDNRLPPLGFTSSHYSYDTVLISGGAIEDENFNKTSGIEGSGKDILFVEAPILGNSGHIEVFVKIHYQTVSNRWLENMFTFSSSEIDLWKSLYNESDRKPTVVASASLISTPTSILIQDETMVSVFPNPSNDIVHILDQNNFVQSCSIYKLGGQLVEDVAFTSEDKQIDLKGKTGVYLINLVGSNDQQFVRKIIIR